MRKFAPAAVLAIATLTPVASAIASPWSAQIDAAQTSHVAIAPAQRVNWYGFSPDQDGMGLVMFGVYSARTSIHMLAYLLTYRPLIAALAEKARAAGVQVSVVVDYGESIEKDRSGYIRARLTYLQRAGVTVCAVDAYRLMHDKDIVLDGRSVQTGSINYTEAGARQNSEDAMIAWNDLDAAAGFEQHFASRLAQCHPI
jgi:phosphatidylserine/phosphatidylglycerophosphate/cardiolipin synthase-like enzyme